MHKRPHTGKSDAKKKRSKTYHCAKERVKAKPQFLIQPNMSGVMVTCTRKKENRAADEVIDLFTEYANEMYRTELDTNEEASDEDQEDIEASIAKEVAELKETKGSKRFVNVPTSLDCVLFIKTTAPIEPVPFIHHILNDFQMKQQKKTRYLSRFLPVEKTCMARMEDIEKLGRELTEPKFNVKDKDGNVVPKNFAIMARVRNCQKIDRMEVIKSLAAVVGPNHKVDLENPELTIIVEICMNICMMSVVQDFFELKKYNIESILGLNNTD